MEEKLGLTQFVPVCAGLSKSRSYQARRHISGNKFPAAWAHQMCLIKRYNVWWFFSVPKHKILDSHTRTCIICYSTIYASQNTPWRPFGLPSNWRHWLPGACMGNTVFYLNTVLYCGLYGLAWALWLLCPSLWYFLICFINSKRNKEAERGKKTVFDKCKFAWLS